MKAVIDKILITIQERPFWPSIILSIVLILALIFIPVVMGA